MFEVSFLVIPIIVFSIGVVIMNANTNKFDTKIIEIFNHLVEATTVRKSNKFGIDKNTIPVVLTDEETDSGETATLGYTYSVYGYNDSENCTDNNKYIAVSQNSSEYEFKGSYSNQQSTFNDEEKDSNEEFYEIEQYDDLTDFDENVYFNDFKDITDGIIWSEILNRPSCLNRVYVRSSKHWHGRLCNVKIKFSYMYKFSL